jgi:hypothetical protein
MPMGGAEREIRVAIECDPQDAKAHGLLAMLQEKNRQQSEAGPIAGISIARPQKEPLALALLSEATRRDALRR